jgi:hypothetical protein
MNRVLVVTFSLLLASPALAEDPKPAAPAPEKAPEKDHPATAKGKKAPAKPKTNDAEKPAAAPAKGQGPGAAPDTQNAAKPPPCVELKPCSID